ncbi:major facilitator superfamily domain-containing protein [Thelonectria olida]|uniref:Major facilitator superfamily domain-containing protein n=1 Tax=Thelonectria olida TaxID=1576542 RepID=A0A9P8VUU7_9HYPO|nr:major facilitator superfamily domain-containing protein [Thelonectria olida]
MSDANHHQTADDDLQISPEHRQYLVAHHGTANLAPLPRMDDADPLNWTKAKKITNLALVAFHAFMATFTAAAIQSAFVDIAIDLGVSIHRATYLTSLVIAILGGAPLFWRPLSHVYGRRPIFLISLICSLVGNVGCALSHSYATMGLCRAITGFFISPAASIGSAVVSETFFRHERARYMGIWTSMVTLGVPLAPVVFGFVALRVGYRWIYWSLAAFILYLFLGPETRYVPEANEPAEKHSSITKRYFGFRRIDPKGLTAADFFHPLKLAIRPCVAIPAASYAMVFLWGSIMLAIEIPQIYPAKFGFNTQQVGLQNISLLVGTIVGEQIGGILSDKWMWQREKRGKAPKLEFRIWLSHVGYLLTIAGIAVFLIQLEHAKTWDITPLIGAGIAAVGNQIVTTVLITYSVDCYPDDAAAIGVFITFVRQIWGFIGPFWFPEMIAEVGLSKSTAVSTALILVVSILPTILLQWKGDSWRQAGN